MKIVVGADHAGYEAKVYLVEQLKKKGYEVIDVGTNSKESCNYASYALDAAKLVAEKKVDYGVLVCGSGQGVCIAANKVKGIRCGIGFNDKVSLLLRTHNDANMIAFGANFTTKEEIINRTLIFLNEKFEGGRHEARVNTISNYEK